jgi:PAS domain S-box-containing protein
MASVLYTGFKDISIGKIRGLLAGTSFFPTDLAVAKSNFLQNSDAVLIGPDRRDVILAVQQIYKIDPQITVIVLCYNEIWASLKKEMLFTPFIGRYITLHTFENLDPDTIRHDLLRSTQRRSYAKVQSGLDNIPLTSPAILPIEHLGTFLEQAPVGAILLDAAYKVVTANGQAKRLLSPVPNIFTKLSDVFDQIQEHQIRNLIENEESSSIEIQLNLKFLSITIAKVVNELGDPFVILLINDITAQSIEKQRIVKILDAMPQIGWLTDPYGSIVHLTTSWFEQIGEIDNEKKSKWEDYILNEDYDRVMKQWNNSLQTKEKFEQEVRFKMHNDQYRWHLVRAVPISDDNGAIEYWLSIATDITQQKAVEANLESLVQKRTENLIVANERLLKSNSDLAEFAHIASHDLQEPIRKIRIFINMMRAHIDDRQKIIQNIDKVEDAASRMSDLIRGILNHSNITNSDALFTTVDLDKIIKAIVEDFDIMVHEKSAVISFADLPIVYGVELQLQQLFSNLISNALKYNTEKPVIKISSITVTKETAATPVITDNKKYYEIAVQDNGIGFDQQYADKIFAVFGRLHSKSQYSGTGIGLALCKKITDRHDGFISAVSSEGNGATFFVYLPCKQQ